MNHCKTIAIVNQKGGVGVIGACLVKQKHVGDCGGVGSKPVILNGIFYRVSLKTS